MNQWDPSYPHQHFRGFSEEGAGGGGGRRQLQDHQNRPQDHQNRLLGLRNHTHKEPAEGGLLIWREGSEAPEADSGVPRGDSGGPGAASSSSSFTEASEVWVRVAWMPLRGWCSSR